MYYEFQHNCTYMYTTIFYHRTAADVRHLLTCSMVWRQNRSISRKVSLAKHSVWLPRKMWLQKNLTTRQTDARQSDPYVPLCFTGDTIRSCQKITMLAGWQPSLNSSQGYSLLKLGQTSRSKITVPCERSCHKEYTCICNMKALSLLA